MRKKLTDNIALKIVSVAVGFLLWLIVANVDNPVIDRNYTLQNVELVNEAYIYDTGKMCLRDGDTTQIRVTITGERKRLSGITMEDIHLTADLQQAVSLDTNPVMIPITATCNGISASNIRVTPSNISVRLEKKVTSEFMVSVNSGDSTPGSGYDVGVQTASPEKVRITGPESLMSKIDKVVANVKVDGITTDKTEEAKLTVLDKNGDLLTDLQMSNLRFNNDGKVSVTTKLWKIRSDIKLDVTWFGVPEEGYVVSDISTVPATISVAGTTAALDALKDNNNTIRIVDPDVDVSDADSDMETKINIYEFLPEDLKLTTGSSDEVLVTVSILPDGSKKYSIPTSEIKINNRSEHLQVTFDVDKVEIRVKASDSSVDISDFDVNAVKASIDVKDIQQGTYEVPVNLVLPKGYELISDAKTEISVSEVSVAEEENKED